MARTHAPAPPVVPVDNSSFSCWSCKPLDLYLNQAESFASTLTDALAGPMWVLFGTLASIWVVVTGIRIITKGSFDSEVTKDLVMIGIAASLLKGLSGGGGLVVQIYSACLDIIAGASRTAFEIVGGVPLSGYSGIAALAAAMEKAISTVIQVASAIVEAGGMTEIMPYLYWLLLVIPYVAMSIMFLAQVVMAIFRLVAVTAAAPFLLICLAFGWGRQMAMSGAKLVMSTGLILFFSSVSMGMAMSGVAFVTEVNNPEAISAFATITNPDFVVIIAFGFLGFAFLLEASAIANAIAGTFLSNSGASSLSSPFINLAKKAGMNVARNTMDAASQLAGRDSPQQRGRQLADKVRNANAPTSTTINPGNQQ